MPNSARSLKLAEQYRERNVRCAAIIAADPEKHPAGSLLARWARLVLDNRREQQEGKAR